jgi:glycosyltransferase involved in cell wall biosynthesis
MIVKNEEKYLRGCFESVRNLVNQIVVVDTGSNDSTIEIAKEFNAEVFSFKWINDFSAARNFALSKSVCNWILYLDADERLSDQSINEVKRITKSGEYIGVNCFVKSPDEETGRENIIHYPRLFRNSNKIKFNGSVHEQILESLLENNYKIIDSSIEILHLGYNVSKLVKKEKAERNLELLLKDYKSNPAPYSAFQLAQTYNVLERYDEAVNLFKEFAQNKKTGSEVRLLSYYNIAVAELRNHKLESALKFTIDGLKIDDEYAPLNYLLSKICLRNGDVNQAIKLCKKTYRKNILILKNKSFSDNDIVLNNEELILYGLNLSRQAGDNDSVNYFLNEYSRSAEYNFIDNGSLKSEVIKKIILKNKIDEQEIFVLESVSSRNNIEPLVSIITAYNISPVKNKILEKLKQKFNSDCTVLTAFALSLLEEGQTVQATELLEQLLKHNDVQPSVAFYLISVYINKGKFDEIARLIDFSETKFSTIPEAKAAIGVIKQKIKGIAQIA